MGIQRPSLFLTSVVLGLAGTLSLSASANVKFAKGLDTVPGEIIFKMKADGNQLKQANLAVMESLSAVLGQHGVLSIKTFRTDQKMAKVKIANPQAVPQAIAALKQNPNVKFAEPNYRVQLLTDGQPNDPDLAKTWGLINTGQADSAGNLGKIGVDVNVLPLWKKGIVGDRKVVVAVIDTGVQWDHPDLKDNLYTNAGDADGDGKDSDGNGFVDDIHGWNFAAMSDTNPQGTNQSQDDHDHGSHCSGTIGATGNDGVGITGVNWMVSIMPIKFLNANGSGSYEGAIEAVNYAAQMKVNIMSNSWGGGSSSDALTEAVQATKDQGILFVAAAGNDNKDNDVNGSYPANIDSDNVVSVAAIDNQEKRASFSNFGKTKVHVSAPGVRVYSTVSDSLYATFSGTSMATPHVSGVAALIWSANPNLTYAEIKERLINTSVKSRGLLKVSVSGGRVDASNALENFVPPSQFPSEGKWTAEAQAIETDHPYEKNLDKTWTLTHAGSKFMRVVFEKVELDAASDRITIETPAGEVIQTIRGSGVKTNVVSDFVDGDTLVVRLKTNATINKYGFKISESQYQ